MRRHGGDMVRDMGNVVPFRVELGGSAPRSRTLLERLFVRAPGVFAALSALVLRLRPGSRLKRALMGQTITLGFAAFNRRDFDPVFVQFAPDIEYEAPAGAHALGFSGTIRGREALRSAYEDTFEHWEMWEIHPAWILDRGDMLAVLATSRVRGRESGVEIAEQWASVYRMCGGLVAHQRDFIGWEKALAAMGAGPELLT
jgi:ketosteroid isomerase-like protein